MNTTIKFPNKREIEEAAGAWLAALDRGLLPHEQQQLEDWLQASSLHAETLLSFAQVWDKLDALAVVKNFLPQPTSQGEKKQSSRIFKRAWPALTGLAAALVIAAALFVFQLISLESSTYRAQFASALGEQKELKLPDGTAVTLNTNTQIEVEYQAAQRIVTLVKGEAFFQVVHNPSKPFIVNFNRSVIQVLGTTFNVQLNHQQGYEVLVLEGKVSVVAPSSSLESTSNTELSSTGSSSTANHSSANHSDGKRRWLLTAGKNLFLDQKAEAHIEQYDIASLEDKLAWRQGHLLFNGETLDQVISELNRYTERKLVIKDSRLNTIPVSGYFRTADIDTVLLVLKQNFGINNQQTENTVYLSRE